ncbi:MAG: glycosyltransferase family 39 protein [Patescibacteria group bacterium]
MLNRLNKEILANKFVYFLLLLILVGGIFLRVYRINDLLGFYYDQGRDALTISDIWHKGDIPFIGPTTGIAGIFRGPFYYYLIAPFYLLGGGDPIYPSIFLSFTTILAVLLIYYLGFKIHGRVAGLIAAIIAAFSFNIVMASRWLSNPTPMLLISMLLVLAMLKVSEGKKNWWPVIAFVSGISLFHFGSSGEVFYFPALIIFVISQRKNFPRKRLLILTFILFFVTILPLIAFDIKNKGLIIGNVKNFLFLNEGSFGLPPERNIGDKIDFLYDVFTNKIFNGRYVKENIILAFIGFSFIYKLNKLIKVSGVKILILFLTSGSLGIIFFQGNFGNIYDYYLTGYYLIFILLFAISLGVIWQTKLGKLIVIYFIYFFITNNANVLAYKLSDKVDGPFSVAFKNQKQAINWTYLDANSENFNVDVYVPPVIPYAYDYLFKWYPTSSRSAGLRGTSPKLVENQVPLLYTLYEVDPPHPERLEAWLARQKGIGKVEYEEKFGGITVQRRKRIQ